MTQQRCIQLDAAVRWIRVDIEGKLFDKHYIFLGLNIFLLSGNTLCKTA